MSAAKVFKSGNSWAVRIPKEFEIESQTYSIRKLGSSIVLEPVDERWASVREAYALITDDFMSEGREQPELPKP
jgi:antitoxin VapB